MGRTIGRIVDVVGFHGRSARFPGMTGVEASRG
jgi:hypothetical protein